MPFIPRYFTYSSMTFSPLFSICSFYSGNWYYHNIKKHPRNFRNITGLTVEEFEKVIEKVGNVQKGVSSRKEK
ncbi:hypothetical protein [Wolbachia endosymbiont of Frankliniella intonsa]|uniref:hypothetical protein n=1 Tax=Wolbachia endosymbiont of Frankliniella intonsa TaxID=2902422 RepID=UPI00244ED3B4|nr:hypothetical protein [Wolbachia endosymbiont of Frankliniella intonsa]WGJ61818.1 hypothetical protein M3L71_05775 [Wolbachia endosymbiont of Frankliniella intonsa]